MHRWILILAGVASVGSAQTSPRQLAFVPASVEGLEVYPRPVQAKARLAALGKQLGEEKMSSLVMDADVFGFDPDLIPGAVVVARPAVKKEAKNAPKKAPGVQDTLLICADPDGLARLKPLGAVKGKEHWTYTVPGAGKNTKVKRHAAVTDGFLLVATSPALLQAALDAGRKPSVETGVPMNWVDAQDAVLMPTASGVKAFFKGFRSGVSEGTKGGKAAKEKDADVMARALMAAGGRLEAATAGMAMGVTFDPASPKFEAQMFLRPGSALAQDFAKLTPLKGGLFSHLQGEGYALATGFGGSFALAFEPLIEDIQKALMAKPGAEDAWKTFLETSRIQTRAMSATAWSLGAPSKKGDSVLSGLAGVTRVTDAKAYLARMVALQGQMATLQREAGLSVPVPEVKQDVLPGVPSATFTYDLQAHLGPDKANPQTFMAFTMLFGAARPAITTGVLDDQTLVTVLGDGRRLKAELERQKAGPALDQDLGVAATTRQLGAPGGMDFLVSLKGVVNLVRSVGETLQQPLPPLPAIPDVPPLGLRLRVGPDGLALVGTAPMETIKAVMELGKTLKPAEPKEE